MSFCLNIRLFALINNSKLQFNKYNLLDDIWKIYTNLEQFCNIVNLVFENLYHLGASLNIENMIYKDAI